MFKIALLFVSTFRVSVSPSISETLSSMFIVPLSSSIFISANVVSIVGALFTAFMLRVIISPEFREALLSWLTITLKDTFPLAFGTELIISWLPITKTVALLTSFDVALKLKLSFSASVAFRVMLKSAKFSSFGVNVVMLAKTGASFTASIVSTNVCVVVCPFAVAFTSMVSVPLAFASGLMVSVVAFMSTVAMFVSLELAL